MGKQKLIKIRKTLAISLLVFFLMSLTTASVSAYNDPSGTKWRVASFENEVVGNFYPVPWLFYGDQTANEGTIWTGSWAPIFGSDDRIELSITYASGTTDHLEVVFLNPNRFIAYKNGETYRYGERI
jgi:hypothetical protein